MANCGPLQSLVESSLALGEMICIEESRYHNNLQEDTSLDGYRVITLLKFMEGAFTPFVGYLVRILTNYFFSVL